jgi:hypothetical protein
MSFRRKIIFPILEREVPQDTPWIPQTTKVRMKKELVINLECGHTIFTTSGQHNKGKSMVCHWCEFEEERQE